MVATSTKPCALVANEKDSVAILLAPVAQGEPVTLLGPDFGSAGAVEARGPIEPFHKIAIRKIAEGESIVKLGEIIGRATCPIARGDHVHVHNVVGVRLSGGAR